MLFYGILAILGFQPLIYCLKNVKFSYNVQKCTLYKVKKFEAKALNSIEALTKNFQETNLTQPHPPQLGLIIKLSKKDLQLFGLNEPFPNLIKYEI